MCSYVCTAERGDVPFVLCVVACEEQRNRRHVHGINCILWTSPRLVSEDDTYDIVPEMRSGAMSLLSRVLQPARRARDAMSHGTQHLFPLGPIIATLRLRIHKPGSGLQAAHADDFTFHLPQFE